MGQKCTGIFDAVRPFFPASIRPDWHLWVRRTPFHDRALRDGMAAAVETTRLLLAVPVWWRAQFGLVIFHELPGFRNLTPLIPRRRDRLASAHRTTGPCNKRLERVFSSKLPAAARDGRGSDLLTTQQGRMYPCRSGALYRTFHAATPDNALPHASSALTSRCRMASRGPDANRSRLVDHDRSSPRRSRTSGILSGRYGLYSASGTGFNDIAFNPRGLGISF